MLCSRKTRIAMMETIYVNTYYGKALQMFTKNYDSSKSRLNRVRESEAIESILAFVFGTIGLIIMIVLIYTLTSLLGLVLTIIFIGSWIAAELFYKQCSGKD